MSGPSLRSSAADDLSPDDILYREKGVTVMPSWLEIDGRRSYAVRSIVRLTLSESAPPRRAATAACLVFLALALISGVHLVRGTLMLGIAWPALAASLIGALIASHAAFVRPTRYALEVLLADGTPVRLERAERGALLALHRALSRAMERQRGS